MKRPRQQPATFDVFFSYNRQNGSEAEGLASRVKDDAKLEVFFDRWYLRSGYNWQPDLEDALSRSVNTAVLLGPGGLGQWQHEEMQTALNLCVTGRQRAVIPVLLPGANPNDLQTLPLFLGNRTWLDIRSGVNDLVAVDLLVASIRGQSPAGPLSVPAVPMFPVGDTQSAALFDLVEAAFSADEFAVFCRKHFEEVHREFTAGMGQGQRIILLIDRAERHDFVNRLTELVRKSNPKAHARIAPRLACFGL